MSERPAGSRVGGYVLESLLGSGGVSEVYAARHAFTGQPCALKVLQLRHVGNARLTELATAEASALARIRHANLVPVSDAGITPDGVVWMVMPRLDGWTLREHLGRTRGSTSLAEQLRVGIEVCDGVAAAHEEGILHRDVKPENIFVTRRGEVVVLDLGMAKFQDFGMKSTGTGKIVGTVRYMAPEQILGKRLDVRADVYSVGVVLHEMLAGVHPFDRGADGEVLTSYQVGMAHLSRPAPRLTGVPDELAALVARTLEKDAAARPSTLVELAQSLRACRRRALDAPAGGRQDAGARSYLAPRVLDELETPPTRPRERVVVEAAAEEATPLLPVSPENERPPGPTLASTAGMDHGMPLPGRDPSPGLREAETKVARPPRRLAAPVVGVAVGLALAVALQLALHGARFP